MKNSNMTTALQKVNFSLQGWGAIGICMEFYEGYYEKNVSLVLTTLEYKRILKRTENSSKGFQFFFHIPMLYFLWKLLHGRFIMIDALEFISDKIGIVMGVVIGIIVAIALIRTLLKASRGESIKVPPIGVMNDLPSSVTGINKHDDMSERSSERANKKTE